jgi:glycosyltransferase involved in cell wall biosynthesis
VVDVVLVHAPPRHLEALTQTVIPGIAGSSGSHGAPTIAVTTWESSSMPEPYANALVHHYDGTIVPSTFCQNVIRDAFIRDGYHDHRSGTDGVLVIPHCFDETWWPAPALRERGEHDKYRCRSIGASGERKNMMGVLKAYIHAFERRDPVELMLVIQNPDFDEIRSVIACSGIPLADLPVIHIPAPRELTERELVDLHQNADCFVSATRCEGWGLGLFEAAILGKLVIAPTYGGHADFLRGPRPSVYGFLDVDWRHTPCWGVEQRSRTIVEDGMARSTIAMPPGVNAKQHWAEPDLYHLSGAMKLALLDPRLADFDMVGRRAWLERKFGFRVVGEQFAAALKGLLQ